MSKTFFIYDNFKSLPRHLVGYEKIVVLIDENIAPLYGKFLPCPQIVISTGERNKTLSTIESIIGRLMDMECSRDTLLLCAGGGILTDIGGFAASIYKRGIRFAHIPTTLLSQVDASIGGKTGVNFQGYKNIIGTFSHPEFTYINTSTLKTLPHREILSGAAELVKAFAIKDQASFERASRCFSDGINIEAPEFKELIATAMEIKQGVVERDFRESGERRLLNFGHTFGHAIEKCAADASDDILHGEAVAIGMAIAAKISTHLRLLSADACEGFIATLRNMGFDLEVRYPAESLVNAIKNDKKRGDNGVYFVLLQEIGTSCVEMLNFTDLEKIAADVLH